MPIQIITCKVYFHWLWSVLGNLLPPISPAPGKTALTVRIEKMGIKHAADYIDPFITVSVKGNSGGWPVLSKYSV